MSSSPRSRGGGAFLDGRPIHSPDQGAHRATRSCTSACRARASRGSTPSSAGACASSRAMGSATLALTYLANGRFDAYVQYQGLSTWDICAAGVIAIEGGAT